MTERPLMTADELKSIKKGSFIVMKTGAHPFVSQLKLFMKWGISFPKDAYTVEDRGARKVRYISREKLIRAITDKYPPKKKPRSAQSEAESGGQIMTEPVEATPEQELNHIAEQAKTAKPLRTGYGGDMMSYFKKLYENGELPHRAKLVYIYLFDRMDKEKKAWPGIKIIAQDLSLSRSTVKRAIKDLEKSCLIRIEPHYRENGSATSNRYFCFEICILTPRDKSAYSGSPQSHKDFVGRGRAAK